MLSSQEALAIISVVGDPAVALMELCGRSMIQWIVESALTFGVREVVIATDGDQGQFSRTLQGSTPLPLSFVNARDTGALVGVLARQTAALCFLLPSNRPLLTARDLEGLKERLVSPAQMVLLVEADSERRRVPYAGARALSCPALCRADLLRELLAEARDGSQGGAFDCVLEYAERAEQSVVQIVGDPSSSVADDYVAMARVEETLFRRIADDHRRRGAWIRGGARIDAGVTIAPAAVVEDRVTLRGATTIGAGARIDVGCVLVDTSVAARAYLKPYTVCARASVGEAAEVGPFSHLRPDTSIENDARIGNFVETKNVVVRSRAMANHLAYLGDGEIGEGANIGAGTIFCNSDGINKFRTEVGKGAFVGSDCQLVAPVRVGAGAFVATGTTVTADVPDDALAIARVRQENKPGYAIKLRARFAAISAKLRGVGG